MSKVRFICDKYTQPVIAGCKFGPPGGHPLGVYETEDPVEIANIRKSTLASYLRESSKKDGQQGDLPPQPKAGEFLDVDGLKRDELLALAKRLGLEPKGKTPVPALRSMVKAAMAGGGGEG